jgi:hypothetical protein
VPTVALRVSDADADEARCTDENYDDAYDAWLDLPVGDDLCDEYEDGKLTDELIEYVYPRQDPDAVEEVLAEDQTCYSSVTERTTPDWQTTISASGKYTLTCHFAS